MTETSEQQPQPKKKELFTLPPEQRRLEAVRKVNEMATPNIAQRGDEPWPIELVGYKEHATALLDLVYKNSKPDSIGVILNGSIKADAELVKKLKEDKGFLPVRGGGNKETTLIKIDEKEGGVYSCKFGYSARGTSVERAANGTIDVHINNDPNSITDESLFRLYKLTGNPSFVETLGIRAEIRGSGAAGATAKRIDPEGYYATLGLNPYALRFLDEQYFNTLVSGMKREVARKLHPDSGNAATEEEMDYLKKMLRACDVLEKPDKRKQYSAWLNLGNGETKATPKEEWKEV